MNQPTREEFDELKKEVRQIKQQITEPIKVTVECRQTDLEIALDNHTAMLQELSAQSDRHTQAFQKVMEILDTHTESISALQADISNIKATQSDHGEMLKELKGDITGLKATQNEHGQLLRAILDRLPQPEGE